MEFDRSTWRGRFQLSPDMTPRSNKKNRLAWLLVKGWGALTNRVRTWFSIRPARYVNRSGDRLQF